MVTADEEAPETTSDGTWLVVCSLGLVWRPDVVGKLSNLLDLLAQSCTASQSMAQYCLGQAVEQRTTEYLGGVMRYYMQGQSVKSLKTRFFCRPNDGRLPNIHLHQVVCIDPREGVW